MLNESRHTLTSFSSLLPGSDRFFLFFPSVHSLSDKSSSPVHLPHPSNRLSCRVKMGPLFVYLFVVRALSSPFRPS